MRRLWTATIALGLGGMTACSNTSDVASKYVKSQLILADQGGTLSVSTSDDPNLAGTVLLIPPGALTADTTVTLLEGSSVAGQTVVGPIAEFGPADLQLNAAATLTLPFLPGAGPSDESLAVAAVSADGTLQILNSSQLAVGNGGQTVVLPIGTFASFCVIRHPQPADGGEAPLCQNPSDCRGALPDYCLLCSNGSDGCAHWDCVDGVCKLATCEPADAGTTPCPVGKYPCRDGHCIPLGAICPTPSDAGVPGSCSTTSDCHGILPALCLACGDGRDGCEHWECVEGECQIVACEPSDGGSGPHCPASESACPGGCLCENGWQCIPFGSQIACEFPIDGGPSPCLPPSYLCHGQCIPGDAACGSQDGGPRCPEGDRLCPNGSCVPNEESCPVPVDGGTGECCVPSDCHEPLPASQACLSCSDGQDGCAHWSCVDHRCTALTCDPSDPNQLCNGQCISDTEPCEGKQDAGSACPPGEYRCPNGYCIQMGALCVAPNDAGSACPPEEHLCPNGSCIPMNALCTAPVDAGSPGSCSSASDCRGILPDYCLLCSNGSDGCAHWSCVDGRCEIATCEPNDAGTPICPVGQYQCASGQCLPLGTPCSGAADAGSARPPCTSASDCHGALPQYCLVCSDGKDGCAHWACEQGECTITACD